MKKCFCFCMYSLIVVLITKITFAQSVVLSNPQVVYPVKIGLSQPVRELPIEKNQEDGVWKDKIIPLRTPENFNSNNNEVIKDGSLIDYQGPYNASAITQNFDGVPVDLSYTVMPPDPSGDVGPNHYVQMVNLRSQIWDKNGNSLAGPFNNSTFWAGLSGPWSSSNDGDPIVLYDEMANRWFVSQFALPNGANGPCYILAAVSKTSDPTGQYWQYAFTFPKMPDYPKYGIWSDGYYMSANTFSSTSYLGTYAAVFDRNTMLSGGAATMQYFTLSTSTWSLLPSDCDGVTPPAGAPNYFLATYNGSGGGNTDLDIYEFHVDWANPANTTFTGPLLLTTPSFSESNKVPQLGTSYNLDQISDRPMNRLQYRNFGSHQGMVVCQTVNAGSGRAGIRWWELRKTSGAWSIYQEGTYAPADGLYRWMGSIAMDSYGNIALGYSTSGSTIYPDIRYTGRMASDPPGVMTIAETVIYSSSGCQNYSGTRNRWGDYTQMTVDPSISGTFWYTNEYIPATGSFNWRTRIAAFNIGPTVSISHTPLSNTEDVWGPYSINAAITATNPLNTSSIKVYWGRGISVISDSVVMSNIGEGLYQASIPGNGLPNTYNYYIKALDNIGTVGTSPGGAPGNYHSFIASVDNTAPVIIHTPLPSTIVQVSYPPTIQADVTDNIGVQSVICEFRINGGSISTFPMPLFSGNTFKGTFTGSVNIGDFVEYRIKAIDNSSQNNVGYNPSSGYHSFTIIGLAPILVAYDSTSANGRISKDSVVAYLNNKGLSYDLFNKGGQTSTNIVSFRGRKTLIWLGEATSVMSTIQKDSVKAFLNNPTVGEKSKLIIFSEDIGYQFGRSASSYYDLNFMNQYLGANYVLDRPASGANQGLVGVYLNTGLKDSTVGTWPDVLSRFDPPTTHDLYKFRGDNSINAIGKIGTTFNVATFGVDIRSLRRAIDSPSGSPVPRFLDAALLYVNTNGTLTNFNLDLTAIIEGFYNGSSMVQDTVTVELRQSTSPYNLVESKKAFLNTFGNASVNFSTAAESTPYYLVIKHRNSIETWSSSTPSFSSGTMSYNFTTSQSQAFGANLKSKLGKWCILGGEVANSDQYIDGDDVTAIYNVQGISGYVLQDVTGDDYVDGDDVTLAFNNQGLGGVSPIVKRLTKSQLIK